MKKIIILLTALFILPSLSYAGFPINETNTEKTEKIEKDNSFKKADKKVITKRKLKKLPFIKRMFKKMSGPESSGGSSTMNWLSFTLAVLALLTTAVGAGLIGIPLAIAAIILGIIGLKNDRPLRGLGIAGVALGGTIILLWLLLIVILAAILL